MKRVNQKSYYYEVWYTFDQRRPDLFMQLVRTDSQCVFHTKGHLWFSLPYEFQQIFEEEHNHPVYITRIVGIPEDQVKLHETMRLPMRFRNFRKGELPPKMEGLTITLEDVELGSLSGILQEDEEG